MRHDRMLATRNTYTWINKYIFPGGFLPSVEVIDQITRAHTGLRIADRLSFGSHYAETLRQWDERFLAAREQVLALGLRRDLRPDVALLPGLLAGRLRLGLHRRQPDRARPRRPRHDRRDRRPRRRPALRGRPGGVAPAGPHETVAYLECGGLEVRDVPAPSRRTGDRHLVGARAPRGSASPPLAMVLTAYAAQRAGRVSVVDVTWGLALAAIAVAAAVVGTGTPWRRWLVAALVLVWGARLARHIFTRAPRQRRGPAVRRAARRRRLRRGRPQGVRPPGRS